MTAPSLERAYREIDALDFPTPDVRPCEVEGGCPYAGDVRWRLTYSCGCSRLVCARCLTDLRDAIRILAGKIIEWTCLLCHQRQTVAALDLIRSVEALP